MSTASRGGTAPLRPLKWYKNLATAAGRLEAGAFLVEGEKAVRQIINGHADAIIEIVVAGEPSPFYHNFDVRQVNESQFQSICLTKSPQGILAVIRLPQDTYTSRLPEKTGDKILLLEDIQDPGNTGTLIRTAAAFDFAGVVLSEKCADPFSPKCIQSTAGAMLSVWLRRTADYLALAETLQQSGYSLVATDLEGVADPTVLCRQNKILLALGNEASGLSDSVLNAANHRVGVPTIRRKAESLNVAACGAICMYLSYGLPQ